MASQICYVNVVADSNDTIVCSDALRPRLSNRGSYVLLDILRFLRVCGGASSLEHSDSV